MPEIEIRPAIAADIPVLSALDHDFTSEHVWQLEYLQDRDVGNMPKGEVAVSFRQVRLPRAVRVVYPYTRSMLASDWTQRSGMLVALYEGRPIGYLSLALQRAPLTAWVTDLVVDRPLRRQGIGSGLTLAALEWAMNMGRHTLVLEMQPKNYPAIQFARKLGFDFCGYNDRYYNGSEIGIFFAKPLR